MESGNNMKKQKMIPMFKSLGVKLITNGIYFLKKAFHLVPKPFSRTSLRIFLASKNAPLNKVISNVDSTYFYTDIDRMKEIIYYDWTDKGVYVKDKHDCDGFALHFKSHLEEIYGITAVAWAKSIELSSIDTGKHIDYHRANMFIADDNNVMKLYFLEPQTDRVVEIEDYTKLIELTGWKNCLNIIEF